MLIRPYGDTRDDGIIQFSFTLPMPYSIKAADVGKQFLEKLGFHTVGIAECKAIDPEYTLFVAYGRTDAGIDPDEVKGDYLEVEEMDYYTINTLIKEQLGRKLRVVGAAIESDAHTVGIDAIMNMKGFAGNYGLERYPEMDALNMGSQIPCAQLLKAALERDADAILVSQSRHAEEHPRAASDPAHRASGGGEGAGALRARRRRPADQQRVREGAGLRRRLRTTYYAAGGGVVPRAGSRAQARGGVTRYHVQDGIHQCVVMQSVEVASGAAATHATATGGRSV